MKERNVKLTFKKAKKLYEQGGELKEVALQAFSEKELKNSRSHSWKEFCERNPTTSAEYYIDNASSIIKSISFTRSCELDRNVYPTKKYAVAALALTQLLQLRQEWIGNWKPDWGLTSYWCIINDCDDEITSVLTDIHRILSFKTKDMADEFLNDFKDLLEIAKPLL